MLTHWNLLNRLQQAGLEDKDEEDEEMMPDIQSK